MSRAADEVYELGQAVERLLHAGEIRRLRGDGGDGVHGVEHVQAFGAIDNLWKGAASQAVQNLNLMFGLDERAGLR